MIFPELIFLVCINLKGHAGEIWAQYFAERKKLAKYVLETKVTILCYYWLRQR